MPIVCRNTNHGHVLPAICRHLMNSCGCSSVKDTVLLCAVWEFLAYSGHYTMFLPGKVVIPHKALTFAVIYFFAVLILFCHTRQPRQPLQKLFLCGLMEPPNKTNHISRYLISHFPVFILTFHICYSLFWPPFVYSSVKFTPFPFPLTCNLQICWATHILDKASLTSFIYNGQIYWRDCHCRWFPTWGGRVYLTSHGHDFVEDLLPVVPDLPDCVPHGSPLGQLEHLQDSRKPSLSLHKHSRSCAAQGAEPFVLSLVPGTTDLGEIDVSTVRTSLHLDERPHQFVFHCDSSSWYMPEVKNVENLGSLAIQQLLLDREYTTPETLAKAICLTARVEEHSPHRQQYTMQFFYRQELWTSLHFPCHI